MANQPMQLEYAVPVPKRKRTDRTRRGAIRELIDLSLGILLWMFGAIFLLGLLATTLSLLTGSTAAGFPNLLAGLFLIPMWATAVQSIRHRRASAVLGYLHQAVRLNQPFNRVLSAAARSEKGRTSQRLIALNQDLSAGLSIADALAEAVPEISMRALALIDYATRAGSLAQTLNRLVSQDLKHARRQRNDQAFAAWYPFVLIAMICLCVGLLSVFVFPKFTSIFQDFHIPLPALFIWVGSLSNWIWILGPVMVLGILIGLAYQLRQLVRINPPIFAMRNLFGRITWNLPLMQSMIRDRNMSDLCLVLADSSQLGYPLDQSLERAAQLEFNFVFRRRLLNWVDAMRAGQPPASAARQAKMPALLAGMLATARDESDLSDVFNFVGRFHGDRFLVRREAMRAAIVPVFTIVLGLIVGLVALSIFVPLQALIDKFAS